MRCDWPRIPGEMFRREKVEFDFSPQNISLQILSKSKQIKVYMLDKHVSREFANYFA